MPGVESRVELTDPNGRALVAHAADFPSRFGDFVHAVPGWRDGVSHDPVIERRPGDGVWVSREQPGGRLFSVRGVSRRETIAEVEQAAEDLEQFFPNHHGDPTEGLVRALYDGKDRRCVVRIAGSPAITLDRLRREVRWTIPLLAPDPRRYGPPIPAVQQVSAATAADFNLLTNPGFEASVAGWFASTGPGTRHEPLAWVGSEAPWGGSAARWTVTAPTEGLSIGTVVPLSRVPRFVTVAARPSRAALLHLTITWLDAAGRILVVDKLSDVSAAAGAWVALAGAVRPPAGAVSAWLMVDGSDSGPWPVGSHLTVDQALLGASASGEYRDGDSPGWEWTGAKGASTSRMAGAAWELDNTQGTAPSVPQLSFVPAANLSTFSVSIWGRPPLVWSGLTIPAGTRVTVDAGSHQVLLNDQLPTRRWSGPWPEVGPGELAWLLLTTGQVSAEATCDWAPAWW